MPHLYARNKGAYIRAGAYRYLNRRIPYVGVSDLAGNGKGLYPVVSGRNKFVEKIIARQEGEDRSREDRLLHQESLVHILLL